MKNFIHNFFTITLGILFGTITLSYAGSVLAEDKLQWTGQWGTSSYDSGSGVATDGNGNIYVTGHTDGSLDGNVNSGGRDIFLSKYDADGNRLWTRQWGTGGYDYGNGVATDTNGNIYVTGYTDEGSLDSNPHSGLNDIFLSKFDTNGNKLWTRQWGAYSHDYGYGVATDANGSIYVTGYADGSMDGNVNSGSNDIFLSKFDTDGNKLWTRQWGTSDDDKGFGVATDANGSIYITGYSWYLKTSIDGPTVSMSLFLSKYDSDGNNLWTSRWGSSLTEYGYGVATDTNGSIYVTGYTNQSLDGNVNSGGDDIFLTKYDTNGNKLWTRQWGTYAQDYGRGVATDGNGNIYVTGETWGGSLDGNANTGYDIFLSKFDTDGNKFWTKQWGIGTGLPMGVNGVATDVKGGVYVTGYTAGSLVGNVYSIGSFDIFLSKFVPPDSDEDGMPDGYELMYGLDPYDPTDRDSDLDGDGVSNYDEYIAETNPNDSSDYPTFKGRANASIIMYLLH